LAVFITDSAFKNALVHGIVGVGHQADKSGFMEECFMKKRIAMMLVIILMLTMVTVCEADNPEISGGFCHRHRMAFRYRFRTFSPMFAARSNQPEAENGCC
jgi:hypothetical protein